jgi:hypothetical protein
VVTSNQPTGHVKSEPAALGHGGSIARRGLPATLPRLAVFKSAYVAEQEFNWLSVSV